MARLTGTSTLSYSFAGTYPVGISLALEPDGTSVRVRIDTLNMGPGGRYGCTIDAAIDPEEAVALLEPYLEHADGAPVPHSPARIDGVIELDGVRVEVHVGHPDKTRALVEPMAELAASVACRPGSVMVDRAPPGSDGRWYHIAFALVVIALFLGIAVLVSTVF